MLITSRPWAASCFALASSAKVVENASALTFRLGRIPRLSEGSRPDQGCPASQAGRSPAPRRPRSGFAVLPPALFGIEAAPNDDPLPPPALSAHCPARARRGGVRGVLRALLQPDGVGLRSRRRRARAPRRRLLPGQVRSRPCLRPFPAPRGRECARGQRALEELRRVARGEAPGGG